MSPPSQPNATSVPAGRYRSGVCGSQPDRSSTRRFIGLVGLRAQIWLTTGGGVAPSPGQLMPQAQRHCGLWLGLRCSGAGQTWSLLSR
jgi:hypothetical protein